MALRRVGQGQNVIIAYHAVSASHPDSAAIQVLAGVMNGASGGGGRGGRGGGGGGGEPGRLAKALVDTKLAQSANMSFQLRHDPGTRERLRDAHADQSLDAARDAISRRSPTSTRIRRPRRKSTA